MIPSLRNLFLSTMVKTRNLSKKNSQEHSSKQDDVTHIPDGSRFEILSDSEEDITFLTNELASQKLINSKLESQMTQMQQMLEVISLREQARLNTSTIHLSPPVPAPDNSFMRGAAQVIQDSTQVEKSSPYLDSVTTEAWNGFDVKFEIYLAKTGKKFLRDCMKQEVLTYYQAQIPGNCRTMSCIDLRSALKTINQPFLDPMALLRTSLHMDSTESYNSEKTKNYLCSFLNLLERYPIIETSLSGSSIAKMFFTKLHPKELSDSMLDLQVQSKEEATSALLSKIRIRDIALAEIPQHKTANNTAQLNGKPPSKNICANCIHSTDPAIKSNHRTWFCKKITEFCYKCNKKHMAYGQFCPHKDKSIFDYEQYNDKHNKDGTIKEDQKKNSSRTTYANNAGQLNNNAGQQNNNTGQQNNNAGQQNNNAGQQYHMDLDFNNKVLAFMANNQNQMAFQQNLLTSQQNQMSALQRTVDDLVPEVRIRKLKTSKPITSDTIFIDTGCSETSITSSKHSDSPIILNRDDQVESIQVADGTAVQIEGRGSLLNHKTNVVSGFTHSLLSISNTTAANNAIAIFTESDCHIVKLDKDLLKLLQSILIKAQSKNAILLNGQLVNGLYVCDMADINKTVSPKICKVRYKADNSFSELDLDSSHHITFAGASYYTNIPSASVKSISDLVKLFHETWNHASEELMCLIVKHCLILNLPPALTVKAIRKYFANCKSCASGNLERQPLLHIPCDRPIEIGENCELDIVGPTTDENRKLCPSFSGMKYMLTCKDLKSTKHLGFLLRNKGYLLRYIKHLVFLTALRNRKVKIIRLDADFVTEEISNYCLHPKNQIQILPCIPHEHATLGEIERDNRTIRETIIKCINSKQHLNFKYWAMCYKDVLFKLDLLPCIDDPTTNAYERWYGHKYDMLKQPILDFGCIVMAHVPLDHQGVFSPKSIETYYVGVHEHGRHGGLLLYNPKSKHTIVRRSFRILGPCDLPSSDHIYEAGYEDGDNIIYHNNVLPSQSIIHSVDSSLLIVKPIPDTISPTSCTLTTSMTTPSTNHIINSFPTSVTIPRLTAKRRTPIRRKMKSVRLLQPNPPIATSFTDHYTDDTTVHQFGNDYGIENDPIPLDSTRRLRTHAFTPMSAHELDPEFFQVERIINHKGQHWRPSSMQLFVKWVGFDDTENSWIKWKDNQELAALDTYMTNNPGIKVPIFKKAITIDV